MIKCTQKELKMMKTMNVWWTKECEKDYDTVKFEVTRQLFYLTWQGSKKMSRAMNSC